MLPFETEYWRLMSNFGGLYEYQLKEEEFTHSARMKENDKITYGAVPSQVAHREEVVMSLRLSNWKARNMTYLIKLTRKEELKQQTFRPSNMMTKPYYSLVRDV